MGVTGQGHQSFKATVGGSGKLYDIKAVPLQCGRGWWACSAAPCPHMCLTGAQGQATCACPDDAQGLKNCPTRF